MPGVGMEDLGPRLAAASLPVIARASSSTPSLA